MPAVKTRVVLVALLLSALAGCSSAAGGDPATDGPLSSGASAHGPIPRGGNCVPLTDGRLQTFADQNFTNHGHVTVVLDRVVLLHPRNQRLIGSYAVPGNVVIGQVPWPPEINLPSTWKNSQPVHGFRVAPGKTFLMVLGATPAGPGDSTSQGMLVYYHDAAGSYVAPNYFGMQIAPGRNGCDED